MQIIGGKWRGKKLPVINSKNLRPTPNRVRETLFNWLEPYIVDASCLDLFAGTGALGIEALSRGAKLIQAIENDSEVFNNLTKVKESLKVNHLNIVKSNGLDWLQDNMQTQNFDIIFLDPPFKSTLLIQSLYILSNSSYINSKTLIYFETDNSLFSITELGLDILKQKKAGKVNFFLVKKSEKIKIETF